MSKKDDVLLVEEKGDGIHVTTIPERGEANETLWTQTADALHSILAAIGLKRIRKQRGSHIGGTYVK